MIAFGRLTFSERTVNLKGCNCPKSKCLMKYCECFNHDIKCSPLCTCVDCHNKDEEIVMPEKLKVPSKNYVRYKKSLQMFGQLNKKSKSKLSKSVSVASSNKSKMKRVKRELSTLEDFDKKI